MNTYIITEDQMRRLNAALESDDITTYTVAEVGEVITNGND